MYFFPSPSGLRADFSPLQFVAFFFLAHLIGWTILFICAYFFDRNPFQANCADELPLRQYSIILGSLTAASLLLAYFFAYLLIRITTAARKRENAERAAEKKHERLREKLTPDRDVLV
jgi:membrane protein DedA with SNARE-associated domain